MPPSPPLFFFGAMSPYSWFAAERIQALLPQARWRGVFAGALFKANDRVSWAITERREDGIIECERRAATHGLGPIRWPVPWPTSDLLIARAMIFAERALTVAGPRKADRPAGEASASAQDGLPKAFALAAMRLAFLEGADLGDADAVLEAGRRVGISSGLGDALAEAQIKDGLRAVNDQALALGVVGVPTVALAGRLFWGDDRLGEAVEAFNSLSASQPA